MTFGFALTWFLVNLLQWISCVNLELGWHYCPVLKKGVGLWDTGSLWKDTLRDSVCGLCSHLFALGRTQVPFHMFLNDCSHLSAFHRQTTRWCVAVCVCSFCMKAVILCCVLWQAYFDSDVATRSAEQLAPDVPVLSNSNSLPSCGSVLPAPESMQLTQVCDLSSILPLNHWVLVSGATLVWRKITFLNMTWLVQVFSC